ncbi:GNAT family N-acetyltransferase [Caulobacter mirabilis]|uniref:GNAT family N-acetyltransferase n=1 Tax=Caulobacter mirabilis TaxID=69666 RepID=A0A2D2AVH2_9CAUL|nr:GNAT family N-acetyltransferase [Caulobacter mirabilis]ATQ41998.1 GNAT family N-acetyltransferase [Caulobacter mirabilis]
MSAYRLTLKTPEVADYLRLRETAGLSPRSREAAEAGLPHTFIGVVVEFEGRAVAMGRIVGDRGLVFQVVDIAVAPEHQGRGLGRMVMTALMDELKARVPAEAHVSLSADGTASALYGQFGFTVTAPASIGMAQWVRRG